MQSDLIYREGAKDYARHAMANGLNVLEYLDEVPAADFRPAVRGGGKMLCRVATTRLMLNALYAANFTGGILINSTSALIAGQRWSDDEKIKKLR